MWFFYLPLSSHQRFWFLQRRWLKRFSVCVLLWNERQQQRPVEKKDVVFTFVFSFENSLWSQRHVRYHEPMPPITHTLFPPHFHTIFPNGFDGLHVDMFHSSVQFSNSVVSDSVTPWIAARQASLSITNSQSSPKLISIESVMPSSHLILCHPLLLLPSIPPSIRGFSSEVAKVLDFQL